MEIAVDFDGTCVSHEFPEIGKEIGAEQVLRKLLANGHRLILFTMRSDIDKVTSSDYGIKGKAGKYLTEAVNWFAQRNIPLYGVNTNPIQTGWTNSPKAYAQLYIDDAALGCPLISDRSVSDRPFVDWARVEIQLRVLGYLK